MEPLRDLKRLARSLREHFVHSPSHHNVTVFDMLELASALEASAPKPAAAELAAAEPTAGLEQPYGLPGTEFVSLTQRSLDALRAENERLRGLLVRALGAIDVGGLETTSREDGRRSVLIVEIDDVLGGKP